MKSKYTSMLLDPSKGILLIFILAVGLGLRLVFARFYLVGGDMVNSYYLPVLTLFGASEGEFQGWDEWHVRLGVILPLALSHWVTPRADMAVPLAALPFSILQILMVYLLGRLLWNDYIARLAAFFEAIYPVSVIFGAKMLPDTPMACSVTAAILCYFYALRQRRLLFFFLAGLCLGLGYTAKITALFILFILAGLFWIHRREISPKAIWLTGIGSLVALVGETLILSLLNGGWHFRPLSLLDTSGQFAGKGDYIIQWYRYFPGFFAGMLWPLNPGFVYHGMFGLAALFGLLILIRKFGLSSELAALSWWWLGLLLLINFACLGYARPIVYNLQMRYLMFMTPAACLLVALALNELPSYWRRGVIFCLLLFSLACCYTLYSTWKPQDVGYRNLYNKVEKLSDSSATIYFHDRLSRQYTRLVVGGERRYVLVKESEQFQRARPGDLASLITGGYIREGSLPDGYREELGSDSWKKIDDWRSEQSPVHTIFMALEIPIKKGFYRQIEIYQRQ